MDIKKYLDLVDKPSMSLLGLIFLAGLLIGLIIMSLSIILLISLGYGFFLNTGYSMCIYEKPYYEFLSINDQKCSWVPLNLLVLDRNIDPLALEPGDNVCYKRMNRLVCHRITKKELRNGEVWYYIEGLHPDAVDEWVNYRQIFAKVIDKMPRAFGVWMLGVLTITKNPLQAYVYLDRGYYLR